VVTHQLQVERRTGKFAAKDRCSTAVPRVVSVAHTMSVCIAEYDGTTPWLCSGRVSRTEKKPDLNCWPRESTWPGSLWPGDVTKTWPGHCTFWKADTSSGVAAYIYWPVQQKTEYLPHMQYSCKPLTTNTRRPASADRTARAANFRLDLEAT